MCAAMYRLTALVVVALALCCRAQNIPECAPTLPTSEIDKIFGQWVLVGAFADFEAGVAMVGNISSSHLELSRNADNTVHCVETNKDLNGVCVSRISEASVVDRDGSGTALTVHIDEFVREQDGVQTKHSATADTVFYQTCPGDCLVRLWRATFFGQEASVLAFYRREGKHLEADAERMKLHRAYIKKQAECLKFILDRYYVYDGSTELCPKKV